MNFRRKKTQTQDLALRLLLAGLIAIVLAQFPLYVWEAKLYDLRFRIHGSRDPLPNITLVGFDDASIKLLGAAFPPTPEQHAELLNLLLEKKPKAIAFTYNLMQTFPTEDLQLRLVEKLRASPIPLFVTDVPEGYGPRPLPKVLGERFISTMQGLTRDRSSYAQDQVSRRLVTHFNDAPSFEMQLASFLHPDIQLRGATINESFQGLTMREVLINYDGPAQTYPISSFGEILTQTRTLPDLSHNIVLIGRADFVDPEHGRLNPFEPARANLSKVEALGQAVASLVRQDTLKKPPSWVPTTSSFLAASVASFITMGSSPALGVVLLLGVVMILFAFSQLAFSFGGIALETMHPILATFITYYVYVPYRLIVEYRKRFYYQKKHAGLKQVEELKSNFISLMSHDIKTPIAKIQGLAETALRSSKEKETSRMLEAIVRSSEDLTKFVNTILDLSKVESGALKMNKASKDINVLVHECLRAADYQAKQKNITLRADLEPLFSVPMDASLIKQVIQNLIDNAIKYSPSGTTVSLHTKEIGDAVEFSITDEGQGIPDTDLDRVFEKFYRPQSSLTAQTPGFGLGLYLVKYFIELHRGHVTASSELGKGSTFRFSLPTVAEQTVT